MFMKVVLSILCVAAVVFMLRVLAALLREAMGTPPEPVRAYLAKFYPSDAGQLRTMAHRQPGEVIFINAESRIDPKSPGGTGQRVAIVVLIAVGVLSNGTKWSPDLRKAESHATTAILEKFSSLSRME